MELLGVITLWKVVVSSHKIVINLPWTSEKLHCKGEPYRFIGQQDLNLHSHRQTFCYFFSRDQVIIYNLYLMVCLFISLFQDHKSFFADTASVQEQLNNLLRRGGPILQQIPQEQLQSIQIRLAEIGPIADRKDRIRFISVFLFFYLT